MSSISHLIGGAFAFMPAFAVHPNDRTRAAEYLTEALAAHVRWHEAEQDIRDYLASKGCDAARIQEEIDRARPLLEPWLT
jgi:hypothetical protein